MRPLGRLLTSRTLAACKLPAAVLVVLATVAACSFIVGDSLPPYNCSPNPALAVCPGGQVCMASSPGQPGLCVSMSDIATDATLAPDGGTSDATAAGDALDGSVAVGANPDQGDAGACAFGAIGCPCIPGDGAACEVTAFCASRTLVAGAYVIDAGDSPGICTKACCTSTDCDKASVCYATGAGGSYCLPSVALGDRSVTGTLDGIGGQSCEGGDSCRSGLCASNGFCADTCCSNVQTTRLMPNPMLQCANGTACLVGQFPGMNNDTAYGPHCSSMFGAQSNGSTCSSDSVCRSNLCVSDTPTALTCRDPCRKPEDCMGTGNNMQEPQACEYFQLSVPGVNSALVAACVPQTRSGPPPPDGGVADLGPCKNSSDCARGYCAPTGDGGNVCVSVCFGDGDCVGIEECRPEELWIGGASYFVLACR